MLNEFVDLDFDFKLMGKSGNKVTPINIGGNDWLNLYNLPRSNFANSTNIKLFDIMMVFVFALVYDTLGKCAMNISIKIILLEGTDSFRSRILLCREDTNMVSPSDQASSGDCEIFVWYWKCRTP